MLKTKIMMSLSSIERLIAHSFQIRSKTINNVANMNVILLASIFCFETLEQFQFVKIFINYSFLIIFVSIYLFLFIFLQSFCTLSNIAIIIYVLFTLLKDMFTMNVIRFDHNQNMFGIFFYLFIVILFMNLAGMFPFVTTITATIAISFSFSFAV